MRRSHALVLAGPVLALTLTSCNPGGAIDEDLQGSWNCQSAGDGGLRSNMFDYQITTRDSSFDIEIEPVGEDFRYTLTDDAGFGAVDTYTGMLGYNDEGEFFLNDNTFGRETVQNLPESLSSIEGSSQAIMWGSNGFQLVLEHPSENEVILRADAPEGAMRCIKRA